MAWRFLEDKGYAPKRMVQTGPRKPFSGFVRLVTFVFEKEARRARHKNRIRYTHPQEPR